MAKCKWMVTAGIVLAALSNAPAQSIGDCDTNGETGAGGPTVINGRTYEATGGQINGAGATLFVAFFSEPFLFNDQIDADGDCIKGFNEPFVPAAGLFGFPKWDPEIGALVTVDTLVDDFEGNPGETNSGHWAFNYRSVGSVNGFNEFIDSELCGDVPTNYPSELGVYNLYRYADPQTDPDTCFVDGVNDSCAPFEQCGINFSFLDVPSLWGGQGPAGSASPFNTPGATGYGQNAELSAKSQASMLASLLRDCDGNTTLESALNNNESNPDNNTIFDVTAAWVPVVPVANHGTGLQNIRYSDIQYGLLTGRMSSGENFAVTPRDAGSGTRNAFHNSIGLDASWGGGDDANARDDDSDTDRVGRFSGRSHRGGSSRVEGIVQNDRIAWGYTGLASPGRAAQDANQNRYEVLATWKDVGADSCATPDSYVFPSIDNVLDNCDPCTGYQIAGSGTFVVRGNINVSRDPGFSCSISGFPCLTADDCRECSISGTPCQNSYDCPMGESCDVSGETCEQDTFCAGGCEDCSNGCPGSYCSFTNKPCVVNGDCDFVGAGEICAANTCGLASIDNKWERRKHPAEDVPNEMVAQFLRNLVDSCDAFSTPSDEICAASQVCTSTGFICVTNADCDTNGSTGETCTNPQPCVDDSDCHLAGDICLGRTLSPCQALAADFFLLPSLDCVHNLATPTDYFTNPEFNASLQTYVRTDVVAAGNGLGWGATVDGSNYDYDAGRSGRVPDRRGPFPGHTRFSDGRPASNTASSAYVTWTGSTWGDLAGGGTLSLHRNDIAGDFNNDNVRNIDDAAGVVTAYYTPRSTQRRANDGRVPELLADFDADGYISKEDLRYFADGLAISGGQLDRRAGAIAIDAQIGLVGECSASSDLRCFVNDDCPSPQTCVALTGERYPWASTDAFVLVPPTVIGNNPTFVDPPAIAGLWTTGAAYEPGDFRGDVAGRESGMMQCSVSGVPCATDDDCLASSTGLPELDESCVVVTYPTPGAEPSGWDGRIDAADIDYVCRNTPGSWAVIDEARSKDLSCDMNGDLEVDYADVVELVEEILETAIGDANLDGAADGTDLAIVDATIALGGAGCNGDTSCGWADGDFDCDGDVDGDDRAVLGVDCPAYDVNCDGSVTAADLIIITNPSNWLQSPPACARADVDVSGGVTAADLIVVTAPGTWLSNHGACNCSPNPTPGAGGCPN